VTTATKIITLALTTSGALGEGQTPSSQTTDDAFQILNETIVLANRARRVAVVPGILPLFPDLATDVPFWNDFEATLNWNLSARLRPLFGMPEDEQQTKLAGQALALLNANNKQFQPPPAIATSDTTGNGLAFLALRAAGRINDTQGVDERSQDLSDANFLLGEMLDEWQRMRTVTVTPGLLPVLTDPTAPLAITAGLRAAIVWGLAVRIRSAFGIPQDDLQVKQAERSLAGLQANNKQQVAPLHPGQPATAAQIVFLALRAAGRITDTQSVADDSADVNDALSLLGSMLAQWSKSRWLVFNQVDVYARTTGALSYTIGRRGQFNLASRAERISSAFVRTPARPLPPAGDFDPLDFGPEFSGGDTSAEDVMSIPPGAFDYPLQVIQSREDYNTLTQKGQVGGIPSFVWLDTSYPLGTVYVWPIPREGQFEIHLTVKATLPEYTQLTDPLNLPPEYNAAMIYNLAVSFMLLNPAGPQPSAQLLGKARSALQTIRKSNVQIPMLRMPSGMPGVGWRGLGSFGAGWGFGGSLGEVPVLPTLPVAPLVPGALLGTDGLQLLGTDGLVLLPQASQGGLLSLVGVSDSAAAGGPGSSGIGVPA
jgi:hypothetical protein